MSKCEAGGRSGCVLIKTIVTASNHWDHSLLVSHQTILFYYKFNINKKCNEKRNNVINNMKNKLMSKCKAGGRSGCVLIKQSVNTASNHWDHSLLISYQAILFYYKFNINKKCNEKQNNVNNNMKNNFLSKCEAGGRSGCVLIKTVCHSI
jgi:hypothetical protein